MDLEIKDEEEEDDFTPTRKKYYCKYYQSRPSRVTIRDGYLCTGDKLWPSCPRQGQCLAAATAAVPQKKKTTEVPDA